VIAVKKKKTPDQSNTGGPIIRYLSAEQLGALNPELGMKGNALNNMTDCLNREIHFLVTRLDLYEVTRNAKKNNRNLDYKDDIDIAAKELIIRISRAPMAIACNDEMKDLIDLLKGIREVISEIQKDPILADFDMKNVYGGSAKDIRINFVIDARNIFRSCSEKANQIRGTRKDGKLLFHLIRMCYERAGVDLSDKTISKNISDAKKSG